ncbi:putative oocyte-secreted protein 1 homolog [Marmota marmota marmota]|uniref:putative oocyte-secreted protein 1 homolog n=1 Tax=Marmota marmota marmota TaxID=9994 RepID=UPI0020938286|nr:putative oocyte-secreted protein 1 homolog [Marmota marmota marmota]
MKTFLALGVLFLLPSLMWICAGDWSAILVLCSSNFFYARIPPTIFYNVHMNHNEAFLGTGCPVTHVCLNNYYEFLYHPQDCGIETQIFQEVVVLKTKIKYVSRNTTLLIEMPLSCVINKNRNKNGSTTTEWEVEVRVNNAHEDTGAACATPSCNNPNVTDPCLPNDVPLS